MVQCPKQVQPEKPTTSKTPSYMQTARHNGLTMSSSAANVNGKWQPTIGQINRTSLPAFYKSLTIVKPNRATKEYEESQQFNYLEEDRVPIRNHGVNSDGLW